MNTLPSGRPLGFGEYKDASRPLRRLLKQYGSGCLETGLHFSKRNGNAKMELVLLLAVDRPVRAHSRDCRQGLRLHPLALSEISTDAIHT